MVVLTMTAQRAAPAARRRAVRWFPTAAVAVAAAGLLLAVGTHPLDIIRYAAYALLGLALPGTLVYRALRGAPHSFADDAFVGTALGFGLELAAWTVFSAADLRAALWCWPALVVVPFAVVPRLRRHWRPRYPQAAPPAWSWAVGAVVVLVLAVVTVLFAAPHPPYPASPRFYFRDLVYGLSLVTEAMHHLPPRVPQVAGEPLHYHWFAYAHDAAASLMTGLPAPVVFYRLSVPLLCVVSVPLLAVVGWRVSGRPWVGAVATTLAFAVTELTVEFYARPSDSTAFRLWGSVTTTYALLARWSGSSPAGW